MRVKKEDIRQLHQSRLRSVIVDLEALSAEGKIRVRCMADLFRAMLNEHNNGEAKLAMEFALAQFSFHTHPIEKMARFADCPGCEAEIEGGGLLEES